MYETFQNLRAHSDRPVDVVVVGAMVAWEDGDDVCVDGGIPVITMTALNELIGEIACQPYYACAHLNGQSINDIRMWGFRIAILSGLTSLISWMKSGQTWGSKNCKDMRTSFVDYPLTAE